MPLSATFLRSKGDQCHAQPKTESVPENFSGFMAIFRYARTGAVHDRKLLQASDSSRSGLACASGGRRVARMSRPGPLFVSSENPISGDLGTTRKTRSVRGSITRCAHRAGEGPLEESRNTEKGRRLNTGQWS